MEEVTEAKPLRLMDLPLVSPLRVETEGGMKEAVYDHPDGMYSYCYLSDDTTKVFHLSLFTPMKLVDGAYEIAD